MNSIIILVIVAISFVSAVIPEAEIQRDFIAFQRTFGKQYSDEEFNIRYENFRNNMIRNEILQQKNPQATFGINKFSDLSEKEFSERYLMSNTDFTKMVKPAAKNFSAPHPKNVRACNPNPTNYNWVSCGVVTPIYNQGQCGSCWAFSATETIESYFALAGNALTTLSMEQIVDCDTAGSDEGCNGGFPTGAYEYVQSAGGIEPYNDYPYTAEGGESGSCTFNSGSVVANVASYSSINGETGLYQQTSSSSGGPVSVCVDASTWSAYTGGIMTSCGDQVDHCVQLVGYANYGSSGAYWVVRNSWGADWGENGFIYLAIGQDLCAIGDYASVVVASTA